MGKRERLNKGASIGGMDGPEDIISSAWCDRLIAVVNSSSIRGQKSQPAICDGITDLKVVI